MNKNLLAGYIQDMVDDYEKMGKDKPLLEWFRDAIKRHIHDITEDEAKTIADKLIFGITAYRQQKTHSDKGKVEANVYETKVNEDDLKNVHNDAELIADAFVVDVETTINNRK